MPNSLKILIVDDDIEILTALSDYFCCKNHSVTTASNGLKGLKLLEAEKSGFDIMITDLVMPDISGVGLISISKKQYPNMIIIGITGWGEHPEALASEANANCVLRKPIELEKLEKIMMKLLSEKRSTKKLHSTT